MTFIKIALVIFCYTISNFAEIAKASSIDESVGKIWQAECEKKRKEYSFNWETPYECCKKKEDECKFSAENEDERKSCEESMKSCTTHTYHFNK